FPPPPPKGLAGGSPPPAPVPSPLSRAPENRTPRAPNQGPPPWGGPALAPPRRGFPPWGPPAPPHSPGASPPGGAAPLRELTPPPHPRAPVRGGGHPPRRRRGGLRPPGRRPGPARRADRRPLRADAHARPGQPLLHLRHLGAAARLRPPGRRDQRLEVRAGAG